MMRLSWRLCLGVLAGAVSLSMVLALPVSAAPVHQGTQFLRAGSGAMVGARVISGRGVAPNNTVVDNCGAASLYLNNASYSSNGAEQYMIQVDMGYGLSSGNWAYATNWSWNDSTTGSGNSGYESFSPTPDWSLTDFQQVPGPGEY